MAKKVCCGIFFILFVLSICISVYSYRKYRQCYFQFREYQELTDRITEENTRLKDAMSDIRKSVDGIRENTGKLEELNGKSINGINECIGKLKEIREKVQIMENYCDNVNFTIGNIDN